MKFKVGDDNYLMELVGSQEYGFIGKNVLVIWKNPEAASQRHAADARSSKFVIFSGSCAPLMPGVRRLRSEGKLYGTRSA